MSGLFNTLDPGVSAMSDERNIVQCSTRKGERREARLPVPTDANCPPRTAESGLWTASPHPSCAPRATSRRGVAAWRMCLETSSASTVLEALAGVLGAGASW